MRVLNVAGGVPRAMFVHVDIAVTFQLFCIVQGLTTAAYLLAHPRPAGNRWLGLLLLGLTLQVVDYFLSRSGVYYRHRELYFTPLFFSWSFGPLLWGYVCSRYGPVQIRWPHFVPVAAQVLFYVVVALQSFDTKTWFWLAVHKPLTRYVEHYGAVASVLGYGATALRRLAQHGRRPRWLWRGLLLVGGFYLAAALDPLVNAAYLPPGAPMFYLTSLVLPVLAYALALLAWRDARGTELAATLAAASAPASPSDTEPAPPAAPAPLPSVAALAPPVDAGQLARVTRALETEELYKNPALTLDDLARHLGLSSNAVSYLLNAGRGESFYDAVNSLRLAEVQRRLLTADARRLTVLALALEAGFNSKTTFNRIFKEKTGLTPKEYRKKYQPT